MKIESLVSKNLAELTRAFQAGSLSATEYISSAEARFEACEPAVLAFVPEENRFERLQKQAEDLLTRYPDSKNRPPLFGAPVGVKDVFHVDGLETHAGGRLPTDELKGNQAKSVTALLEAGALVLGKTVTTEFAYFTPGPTRNPHNPGHTPGGSSSGSAAAVAAGLCVAALGTQTIGSVIRPAAFCGVVGFKPTYDRILKEGVIPLSPSLDHIGFFTSDVDTVKKVANVLVGNWRLETAGQKPTLGIPEGPYLACASDEALASFNQICEALAETGYELRRIEAMSDFPEIRARHDLILAAEASRVHQTWFGKYADLYSAKLSELIKRGESITDDQLQSALEARNGFRREMKELMDEHGIDLWICPPALGPAPKGLESTGDPVMDLPWTQIGFPAINLPAGKNEAGLPMGFQVVGKWNMDEEVLNWSEALEKVVSRS